MKFKKSIGIYFEKTIGDIIYTSSIVAEIRKREPNAFIHIVTSKIGVDILKSSKPDYDQISNQFSNLVNYDIIYYPLRCAQRLPHWCKYKKHIRDLAAESINIKDITVGSNIINPDNKNISEQCRKLENLRYIIINNRASSDRLKELPINTFSNIIKKINMPIYQLGLSQDPPIDGCNFEYLGNTSIIETLYLIKKSYMVIGIDNFFLHSASAYNVPWIGSYGFYHYKQVCPIDINKNKYYKIINKGNFGDYNMNGCNEITEDEIYNKYLELKGEIDA